MRIMDVAVKKHFYQDIKERIQLTGGYSFNTWLLVLTDGQKIIFRTASDYETGGGRKIIISDIFEREKFFYDNVNREIGHICPEVYVIDNTCEYYEFPYQIAEYIEGDHLNLCFDGFDSREKDRVYYKFGETTARINRLEIDKHHPYVSHRGSWEEFISERLRERLAPLTKNGIITSPEADKIADGARGKTARKTRSFLHLDLRFVNMIHNNGDLYILDAENCEFGDPLFELAVIDMTNSLTDSFAAGYKSVTGAVIDLEDDLYNYYKLERQALVLNLFLNAVKGHHRETQYYLAEFHELKNRLLC